MSTLNKFLQPIEIAERSLGEEYQAYKMDDSCDSPSSMKSFVGLGECNCCDYFIPQEDVIVIIEETRLAKSMQGYRSEYNYLNEKDKDDFSIKKVREEMRLKAYGAMLVLCRLAAKSAEVEKLVRGKNYNFWLVASSENNEDKKFFDHHRDDLLSMLRGALGAELLNNVEVIPSDALKKRLSDNDSVS